MRLAPLLRQASAFPMPLASLATGANRQGAGATTTTSKTTLFLVPYARQPTITPTRRALPILSQSRIEMDDLKPSTIGRPSGLRLWVDRE